MIRYSIPHFLVLQLNLLELDELLLALCHHKEQPSERINQPFELISQGQLIHLHDVLLELLHELRLRIERLDCSSGQGLRRYFLLRLKGLHEKSGYSHLPGLILYLS